MAFNIHAHAASQKPRPERSQLTLIALAVLHKATIRCYEIDSQGLSRLTNNDVQVKHVAALHRLPPPHFRLLDSGSAAPAA